MKIELQKWSWQDKQALIKICNNVDRTYLSNRLPHPYTEESADWWLNMLAENDGKTGIFRKIIADGEIVGNITVEKKSDVYSCDSEIGYILLAEKYSKGIMTEAVRQICELAFSALDITRITGLVYEPNIVSRRVLEKNDFVLEGVMKNAVAKNGEIYDLRIYGKIK
ncbi:MAG: GNAT family N-acetyltransferase [Treponemataceae bacterium]|nr:GNAT family N-acetyltransferase [Treponemataceae bacterium]